MEYSGVEMLVSLSGLILIIGCVAAFLSYLMSLERNRMYEVLRNLYKECNEKPTLDFDTLAINYLMGKSIPWNLAVTMIIKIAGTTNFRKTGNVQ